MKTELHNYDIYPKVFIVGDVARITIKPLGRHVAFEGSYKVAVVSLLHGHPNVYTERNNIWEYDATVDENGCIQFSHVFHEESEYVIQIRKEQKKIVSLSVYALEEDMRGRYPYRGDTHVHTSCSDGKQAPAFVAANYRRYGYDFMAITDHHRYFGSLEAMEAYKDVPHELNIVCGEEVHLPGNDIHIVNFGGEYSVNSLIESIHEGIGKKPRAVIDNPPDIMTDEQFFEEINELISTLNIPEDIEKHTYAACVWACNHIRKGNGLSIFAHPYWRPEIDSPFQVPETLREHIAQNTPFDAFEVLGGCADYPGTLLQERKYYMDRERGIYYPAIACTDSHNCLIEDNPNALIGSTFVFAKENKKDELISAIKESYCVAVNKVAEDYRMAGDFRLIKYTCFLLKEFTPLHDELCYEEGRLMKAYASGDEDAGRTLEFLYGRMKRLYDKYFAV